MRTWTILAITAMTVLAGCSDDGKPSNSDDPDEDLFEDVPDVTSDTGLIRGVVLDETITPIVGATITLQQSGDETTSNENGAFVFGGLDPGSYFLEIAKPGFETVQTSVSVVAGVDDPEIVKVQLPSAPGTAPFILDHSYEGRLDCSVKVNVPDVTFVGGNLCHERDNPVTGQELLPTVIGVIPMDRTPDALHSELVWESTQDLGDSLDWMFSWQCSSNGGFLCDHSVGGTSPLVNRMNSTEITSQRFEGTPFGPDREAMVRVFAAETDQAQNLAGVTLQQDFQGFTFMFYNMEPDDDWVFSIDGKHALPA